MSRIREEILQRVEPSEEKFWAVSRSAESRLDFRFSNGSRTSLQYHSIQKFEFHPSSSNEEDLLVIDITGVSKFEIFGKGLVAVYDALNRASVRFIAETTKPKEQAGEDGVFIRVIQESTTEQSHGGGGSNDTAKIQEFLNAMTDEESGKFVAEAYQAARDAGDTAIDDLEGIKGERARWEAVAKKARAVMS